jgi:Ca2+-binding EF-hand superfamily protein
VFERHRSTTQAFRFFDLDARGKIKKSDVITGLEKLRVRLAARDFDLIWEYLDPQNNGAININDFAALSAEPFTPYR